MSRRTGALLPPGHFCTVTFEGTVEWTLPRNESGEWRRYELEVEGGRARQRIGDEPWSEWRAILATEPTP